MKYRFFPRALRPLAAIGLLLLSPTALMAKLELHPLFTDHGVLQQELPVPVWGWADPGAGITVTFGGQTKTATANADGRWITLLDPLAASGEPADLMVKSNAESVKVSDLLVGEVWLCSGQSNMAMSVRGTTDAAAMAAEAGTDKLNRVRLFRVPVNGTDERQDRVNATWTPCTPTTVASFSAAGFYFGRALNTARNVPVGLIQSANGGTNAYSWINRDTLENDPSAAPTRAFWEQTIATYPQVAANYEKALATWKDKVAAAKAAGQPAPKGNAPREPIGPPHVKRPAGHYQAMIAPLQPFAIRGVLWYQGEANSRANFAPQYRDLMFALLEDWRADWASAAPGLERRNFPFYLVQLPNFGGGHENGWPVIREQMLRFWQEGENTGMVVAIDVGDSKNIHPTNKKPVGERLAQFARAQTYGEDLVYSGPIFDSLTIEGGKALLKFKHLGGGLVSTDQQALRHFTIAGTESIFVKANAEIVGDTVVVSSPDVPDPRAVRYAWSSNPENVNLANQAGLPASPFRTDSWEIIVE